MKIKYYRIRNKQNDYWSNEFGWVNNNQYDIFTEKEKKTFNLPIDGRWEKNN